MRRTGTLLAVLAVAALAGTAHGIMRRHDVADAEYVIDPADYPQIVDLLEPGDCLGTLIAPQWILTAAHCAADVPESGHAIAIVGRARAVEGVVCHPRYHGDKHDLALVKLAAPVTDVTPMSLYRDEDEVGQQVVFVGRGDSGTGVEGQRGSVNDGLTRAATNTVHDASNAWLEFVFHEPGDAEVTPREGISGDGDSGGPALIDTAAGLAVAGVSSWQDAAERNVGTYGVHDFYSRVSTDLAFLDETTGAAWDGVFRSCPPEGCRVARASDGAPAAAVVAWILAFTLRRRPRRALRRRPRRARVSSPRGRARSRSVAARSPTARGRRRRR